MAAVLITAGILFLGFWFAGFPALQHDGYVRSQTVFEMVKISLATVAGVGGVVGLVVAYRRQRILEESHLRSEREDLRNHARLQEERFARASEEIASDKAAIQLAGIYALAALADEWTTGRQRCVEVLCGFLRLPPKESEESLEERSIRLGPATQVRRLKKISRQRQIYEAREDVQVRSTVLRLIANHLRADSEVSWAGIDLDFTGALIESADFSECYFEFGRVLFNGATFGPGITRFDRSTFTGEGSPFRARPSRTQQYL